MLNRDRVAFVEAQRGDDEFVDALRGCVETRVNSTAPNSLTRAISPITWPQLPMNGGRGLPAGRPSRRGSARTTNWSWSPPYSGRPDAISLLVDPVFDANVCERVTALHEAAMPGNLAMVKLLLDSGAYPTIVDHSFNSTPGGCAEHNGQADVVAYYDSLLALTIAPKPPSLPNRKR